MHDVIMISGIIRIILGLYNFIVISLLDIHVWSGSEKKATRNQNWILCTWKDVGNLWCFSPYQFIDQS